MFTSQISRLYFFICAIIALVELSLSQAALNLFEHYSIPGGSFIEKMHPATYIEMGFLLALGATGDFFMKRKFRGDFLYLILWACMCLYLAVQQKWAFFSVFVDLYIFNSVAWVFYKSLDDKGFYLIFYALICLILLNLPIVVLEYITHRTLLPAPQEMEFFRPCGLFGHPIFTGYMCCIGIVGARYFFDGLIVRRLVMLAMIVEISLCGVRGPLAVGLAFLAVDLIRARNIRRDDLTRVIFELGIVALGVVGFFALTKSGSFSRIVERGIWDQSAESRFSVVTILSYLKPSEWLWGISADRATYYTSYIDLTTIENPFVVATIVGGIVFAACWAGLLAMFFWQRSSKNILFLALALSIATTSLAYCVKGQTLFAMVLLMELIRRKTAERNGTSRSAAQRNGEEGVNGRAHESYTQGGPSPASDIADFHKGGEKAEIHLLARRRPFPR